MIDGEGAVDLRSDSVTRPTEEMWAAMRAEDLDWSRRGGRRAERVEELAAALTGSEAALLVPTGTMANTLALLCWGGAGRQFVAEDRAHVLVSEDCAFARLAGMFPLRIPEQDGHLQPDRLGRALAETRLGHHTPTSLVWLENTHNFAGGTVAGQQLIESVVAVARSARAVVHMDGARIFNAAAALALPVSALTARLDSVAINVNKALSAPAGAFLCGSAAMIDEARERVVGLGGRLGQYGTIAAAAEVALTTMTERVGEDHEVARLLADELRRLEWLTLPASVPTNIVMVGLPDSVSASPALEALAADGVLALAMDPRTLRLVTHRHVGEGEVRRAVRAFEGLGRAALGGTSARAD